MEKVYRIYTFKDGEIEPGAIVEQVHIKNSEHEYTINAIVFRSDTGFNKLIPVATPEEILFVKFGKLRKSRTDSWKIVPKKKNNTEDVILIVQDLVRHGMADDINGYPHRIPNDFVLQHIYVDRRVRVALILPKGKYLYLTTRDDETIILFINERGELLALQQDEFETVREVLAESNVEV